MGIPIVSHFRQVASEEPPPPASSIHYIPALLLASDVIRLLMAPSSPSTTTISSMGSEINVNRILYRWRRDTANLVLKILFSLVSRSTITTTNSAVSPPPFNLPPSSCQRHHRHAARRIPPSATTLDDLKWDLTLPLVTNLNNSPLTSSSSVVLINDQIKLINYPDESLQTLTSLVERLGQSGNATAASSFLLFYPR